MFKKSLIVSTMLVLGANSVFAQPVVVTEPTEAEKEKALKFMGVDKTQKKKTWAERRAESEARGEIAAAELRKELKKRRNEERKRMGLKPLDE